MRNRVLLFGVVILVLCIASSTTWAFGYLGPPKSTSTKGQLGVNTGYTSSRNDLRMGHVMWGSPDASMTIKKFSSQTAFADLTYGICDDFELFLRAGVTDFGEGGGSSYGNHRLTGDTDPTFGWGIRGTVYKTPKITWGGSFQMNSINMAGRMELSTGRGRIGMDGWEYIASFGPTYHVTERCAIYGGPFFHYISADMSGWVDGSRFTADVETEAFLGAFFGLQYTICPTSKLCFELAHSDNVDALSLAYAYRH